MPELLTCCKQIQIQTPGLRRCWLTWLRNGSLCQVCELEKIGSERKRGSQVKAPTYKQTFRSDVDKERVRRIVQRANSLSSVCHLGSVIHRSQNCLWNPNPQLVWSPKELYKNTLKVRGTGFKKQTGNPVEYILPCWFRQYRKDSQPLMDSAD